MSKLALVPALALLIVAVPGHAAKRKPAPAAAVAPAAALTPATFRVERHVLANGLTVLLHEDHSVPSITLWQWYKVGSRNERPGITGLSHFFEHMMFNGSKNVPPKEYDRILESNGGFSNAFTSRDMTAYYENCSSDRLDTLLFLDADRMASLSLLPDQLKSEIEVVKEERRMRTDNSIPGMLDEALYSNAFVASPYQWPIVGWMGDLERIRREDCVEYFRTYYAPNNCILVLTGDFEPKAALASIERAFGSIPSQAPAAPPANAEPEQNGERRVEVRYPSENVSVDVGYKATDVKSADAPAARVLARVLADGESSRLHRALVYDRPLALGAEAYCEPGLEPGLFELYLELQPDVRAAEALAAADSVLAALAASGPTPRELEKAKNQIEADFVRALKTNNGAGATLGRYEHLSGDYAQMFGAVARVRAVTAEDCRRVATQLFDARRRTVVTLVPEARERAEVRP